jgi:hypothetical protein
MRGGLGVNGKEGEELVLFCQQTIAETSQIRT